MKKAFDDVVIICPQVVTGGPHALHQLAHAINSMGGTARMLYTSESAHTSASGGKLTYQGDVNPAFLQAYKRYEPVIFSQAPLSPKTLVIVPEVAVAFVQQLPDISRAVWWLSVDNGLLGNNHRFRYRAGRKDYFNNEEIYHFFQSDYARNFLQENRAEKQVPLFDYTEPPRVEPVKGSGKRFQFAYFPRKGGDVAAAFRTTAPGLSAIAIENMPHEAVFEALQSSAVYIDFGHHPGKDRVPREAALSGCVVLLHDLGAASFYVDHPLDRYYRFTAEDVVSGVLAKKVDDIVKNHAEHFQRQAYYRQKIRQEKDEFMLQVKSFFFEEP